MFSDLSNPLFCDLKVESFPERDPYFQYQISCGLARFAYFPQVIFIDSISLAMSSLPRFFTR